MIPRTVQMAAEVAAQFTPTELEDYGNIILNGYPSSAAAVSTVGAIGALDTVTIVNGGTGYTDGTYSAKFVSGTKGSFAYADVTVAGGIVTGVTVTTGGLNFVVGESVSVSGIGPGSGLDLTVATVNEKSVRPALKGWTTNYYNYYTELQPNAYNVNPGDPTMFQYSVHSYTEETGTILAIGGLQAGYGYTPGSYTAVPVLGGSGTGATFDITVDALGGLSAVTINSAGADYTFNDGLTPDVVAFPSIGAGTGGNFFVIAITPVTPGGEAKWAQANRRFFQNTVSSITPPQYINNPNVIQYSFIYPVADNPAAPPIGTL